MKAERRHELKHNELADWIGERMETLKPHASGILLGGVLLVVLVLGGIWYFGGENQASASAWSEYFGAVNERDPRKVLQNLATEKSGSKAAWWALESLGDMNLSEGAALLHTDRSEAKKRLEAAEQAYKQVEASDDPMLKARARLGLAKVYESQFNGEKAVEYYELVAKSQKDTAIGKAAAEDARRLKDPRELEFLAWFKDQTPKRPAPFPGIGGAVPGLPNDLPERPDIGLPKSFGLDSIGTPASPDSTPAFPAPGATLPTATPTDSANPPVTSTRPAAPAPDGSKPATPDAGEKKSD
jgi:tetratricopeptide (TPR) repeat protein